MENNKVTIRQLSTFTIEEALEIWHQGFEGYYTPMNRSLAEHVAYLGRHRIHPELSIVAMIDGRPAGFVLTGVRWFNGVKTAWNAGTGVALAFRGQGIGKMMMSAIVQVYRENGIEMGMLEAISENSRAVALYKGTGYQVAEHVICFSCEESFDADPFIKTGGGLDFAVKLITAQEVGKLPFYRTNMTWNSQWPSVTGGVGLVVYDRSSVSNEAIAYALLECGYDEQGELKKIQLYHCECNPNRSDREEIIRYTLSKAFGPFQGKLTRTVQNFPSSNETVIAVLREAGFGVTIEQESMVLKV